MNRYGRLILLLLLALATSRASAQQNDPSPQALPQGTEYYVTFLQNEDDRGAATKFMGLMITSEVATSGLVEVPNSAPKSFSTQPGQVTVVPISRDFELKESEDYPVGAIRITSRAPIAVFAVNSLFQSTGGYAAIPPDLWGTSYAPITTPNADGRRVCEFGVIVMHDSTRVTFIPSTATEKRSAWEERKVTLRRGETYMMKAYRGNTGVADLSLSDISALRPIAVVSGHVRTPIAADGRISTDEWASHQEFMLLPDSLWSTDYITVPMRPEGDRFRIMAANDDTRILITHYPPEGGVERQQITLNRNDIYDSSTSNGRRFTGPVHWSATGPIMLLQMRTSRIYDNNPESAPAVLPIYGLDRITSRSVFVAPLELGLDFFTEHALTIIAKGNPSVGAGDPGNPLRDIRLDGTPVHTLAPELLTQQIGSTGYYYVRLMVDPGGHVLTSRDGYPVTGTITGTNGSVARDSYAWTLPFWIPAPPNDADAPYVVVTSMQGNILKARISDRASSYFSGLLDVKPVNSPGWRLVGTFTPPAPDEDADVSFQVVDDPSGPLSVEVSDRAGNTTVIQLHDGLCGKSAYADAGSISMMTSAGTPVRDSIVIRANPCGDAAEIQEIIFADPQLGQYIGAGFSEGSPPAFTIPGGDSTTLYLDISPGTPQGTYHTRITLKLDISMIDIDIDLMVTPPASVTGSSDKYALDVAVAPNPVTSSALISFGRPLGMRPRVHITDGLGRAIRTFDADALSGTDQMIWNGLQNDGVAAPAGMYFIVVEDHGTRGVAPVTLVR